MLSPAEQKLKSFIQPLAESGHTTNTIAATMIAKGHYVDAILFVGEAYRVDYEIAVEEWQFEDDENED